MQRSEVECPECVPAVRLVHIPEIRVGGIWLPLWCPRCKGRFWPRENVGAPDANEAPPSRGPFR